MIFQPCHDITGLLWSLIWSRLSSNLLIAKVDEIGRHLMIKGTLGYLICGWSILNEHCGRHFGNGLTYLLSTRHCYCLRPLEKIRVLHWSIWGNRFCSNFVIPSCRCWRPADWQQVNLHRWRLEHTLITAISMMVKFVLTFSRTTGDQH